MKPVGIAIVGSRNHPRLDLVRDYVLGLPPDCVVYSGGAPGVDRTARDVALERGLVAVDVALTDVGQVELVHREPGRSTVRRRVVPVRRGAGARDLALFRNTWIAILCDELVAFPDGSKGGTWDAVRQAERFRRPVELRRVDGRVERPAIRKGAARV